MTVKTFTYSFALVALLAFAGTASAQGTATVPRLTMEAEVVTALRLDISNGVGGVAVTSGTAQDFLVDLGTINALGVAPATGVTVSVTPGAGAAGFAIYTAPINLTPVFSGYAGLATIALTTGGGANIATAVEGDSNALATVAAARTVVTGAASDVANVRHVGFKVTKAEAVGDRVAMFLYTITMP